MSNKSWPITIFLLLAVAIFGIGGVVYYGNVALPAQRIQNDVKACDEFANGVIQARAAAMALLGQKPPAAGPEVAKKYASIANQGIDKAFNTATPNGEIYNTLTQIGLKRLDFNENAGMAAVQNMESQYDLLIPLCTAIQPTSAPTASPSTSAPAITPSPSASK